MNKKEPKLMGIDILHDKSRESSEEIDIKKPTKQFNLQFEKKYIDQIQKLSLKDFRSFSSGFLASELINHPGYGGKTILCILADSIDDENFEDQSGKILLAIKEGAIFCRTDDEPDKLLFNAIHGNPNLRDDYKLTLSNNIYKVLPNQNRRNEFSQASISHVYGDPFTQCTKRQNNQTLFGYIRPLESVIDKGLFNTGGTSEVIKLTQKYLIEEDEGNNTTPLKPFISNY